MLSYATRCSHAGDLSSRRCEQIWLSGLSVRHQCICVPLARAWRWTVLSGWKGGSLFSSVCVPLACRYIQYRILRCAIVYGDKIHPTQVLCSRLIRGFCSFKNWVANQHRNCIYSKNMPCWLPNNSRLIYLIIPKVDVSKFKDQVTSCSKQLQLLEISTAKSSLDETKRSKHKVSGKERRATARSVERKKRKGNTMRARGRGTKQSPRCAITL